MIGKADELLIVLLYEFYSLFFQLKKVYCNRSNLLLLCDCFTYICTQNVQKLKKAFSFASLHRLHLGILSHFRTLHYGECLSTGLVPHTHNHSSYDDLPDCHQT